MCAEIVINAGQNAYFGRQLFEIDPNLAQHSGSSTLAAGSSYIYTHAGGARICIQLKIVLAWITNYLEQVMRYLGFDSREIA